MTQRTISIFPNGIYSKRQKEDYITSRTNVYCIDTIKSLEKLDLTD